MRKCEGRCPSASTARLRWVVAHKSRKAGPGATGSTAMSGPLWAASMKAARMGSGVEQVRCGDRVQYFSTPRCTGACAFARQCSVSSVSIHNRRHGNAGSASRRPSVSSTTPVTSSASNAKPRSTSAAASEDLPIPLLPSSRTAPASVSTAAACSVTTPRCCSRAVNGELVKKAVMSSASSPHGSIRMSRPSVTRYRATPSTCMRKAPGRACQMFVCVTWPGPAGSVAGTAPRRTVTSGTKGADSDGSGRGSNGRGTAERTCRP